MRNKINLFFLVIFLIISSCKKTEEENGFSIEPKISFSSITPASAKEYTDKVVIGIKYEDGDGDLGENIDGIKNCFVTDNRIGITNEYRIQQLAPYGYNVPITGYVNIDIGGQVLTDSSTSQQANYTIYVVDRAGHKSNPISTQYITIHK